MRDEAKRELDGANKELKQLEMDVNAGTKAAAAAPVDRDELIGEFKKVGREYFIYISINIHFRNFQVQLCCFFCV